MIGRRTLFSLAGGLLVATDAAIAQTDGRGRRIAVLSPSRFPADEIREVVLPELARRGFVEGRNLTVTYFVGDLNELPRLAREAIDSKPDVVLASTNPAVRALLARSQTVPIVMAFAGEDPVAAGLAKSLARPGGSVTGLTNIVTQLDGKRLSLLHEAVPAARRVAILAIPPPRHVASIAEMQRVARLLGLDTQVFFASSSTDYPAAFKAMAAAGVSAVANASAPEFVRDAAMLAEQALAVGLATIGELPDMARAGYLIGYGVKSAEFRRRAADFVVRIFAGASPGELPIEQSAQFELVVNLKTAQALGLTIPPALLLRADEVIE